MRTTEVQALTKDVQQQQKTNPEQMTSLLNSTKYLQKNNNNPDKHLLKNSRMNICKLIRQSLHDSKPKKGTRKKKD